MLSFSLPDKANTLCIPLPLYHAFACSGFLSVISHGGKFVSPSLVYSGRETVKAIDQEKYFEIKQIIQLNFG